MPLPKRPFTTSSLTSTLKSTIASQPLLSNLNIEKLSSQASSFASPFFGTSPDAAAGSSTNNAAAAGAAKPAASASAAASAAASPVPPAAAGAGAASMLQPAVDMSHLTEQERLMIQSVMAKAAMVEGGAGGGGAEFSAANVGGPQSSAPTNNQLPANSRQSHNSEPMQAHQLSFQHHSTAQLSNNNNNNSSSSSNQSFAMHGFTANDANRVGGAGVSSQQRGFNSNPNQSQLQQQQQQTMSQQQNMQQMQQQHMQVQPQPSIEQQTSQLISQINAQFNLHDAATRQEHGLQHQQSLHQQTNQQPLNQQSLQSTQQQQQQHQFSSNQQSMFAPQSLQSSSSSSNFQQHSNDSQQQLMQQANQLQQLKQHQRNLTSQQQQSQPHFDSSLVSQQQFCVNPAQQQQTQQEQQMILASQQSNQQNFVDLQQQQQRQQQQQQQQLNQLFNVDRSANNQPTNLNFAAGDQQTQLLSLSNSSNSYLPLQQQQQQLNLVDDQRQRIQFNNNNNNSNYGFAASQQQQQLNDPLSLAASQESNQFAPQQLDAPQLQSQANSAFQQVQHHDRQLPRPALECQPQSPSRNVILKQPTARAAVERSSSLARVKKAEPVIVESPEYEETESEADAEQLVYVEREQRLSSKSINKASNSKHVAATEQAKSNAAPMATKQAELQAKSATDEALKLLSELKLTEQASQVMQQQNLLIKQSQELIKLQLEQQALSKELKESIRSNPKSNNKQQDSGNASDQQQSSNSEAVSGAADKAVIRQTSVESSNAQSHSSELTNKQQQQQKLSSQRFSDSVDSEHSSSKQQTDLNVTTTDKQHNATEATVGNSSRAQRSTPTQTRKFTTFNQDYKHGSLQNDDDDNEWSLSDCTATNSNTNKRARDTLSAAKAHSPAAHSSSHNSHSSSRNRRSHLANNEYSGNRTPPVQRPSSLRTNRSGGGMRDCCSSTAANMSPCETTDSELELSIVSHNSTSSRHNRASQHSASTSRQTVVKPPVVRRREPTGLPPSPLPVSAAIQLHQMQQAHFKNANRSVAFSESQRSKFLRSRSVTSSPTHHLMSGVSGSGGGDFSASAILGARDASAELGMQSRYACRSPDTMSEFGGLARRKRKKLPEPPQNTVPLTPLMVRKMLQAQKAGLVASANYASSAGVSSSRMLNSVNIQTTNIANSHAKSSYLTSSSSSSAHAAACTGGALESGKLSSLHSSSARNYLSVSPTNHASHHNKVGELTSASLHSSLRDKSPTNIADNKRELDKFLTSTYGSSILKHTSPTPPTAAHVVRDVKETPELDKLISNLDEFYKMDSKHRPAYFNPEFSAEHSTTTTAAAASNVASSLARQPPTHTATSFYTPQHASYASKNNNHSMAATSAAGYSPLSASSRLLRRSSESEALLGSRLPAMTATTRAYTNYPSATYDSQRQTLSSSGLLGGFESRHAPLSSGVTSALSGADRQMLSSANYLSKPQSELFAEPHRLSNRINQTSLSYLRQPTSQFASSSSPLSYNNNGKSQPAMSAAALTSDLDFTSSALSVAKYGLRPHSLLSAHNQRSLDLEYRGLQSNLTTNATADYYSSQRRPLSNYVTSEFATPTRQPNLRQLTYSQARKDHSLNYPNYNSYRYGGGGGSSSSTTTASTSLQQQQQQLPQQYNVSNKYVTANHAKSKASLLSQQTNYAYPYKRVLLCRNPKDRLGNGYGINIVGGVNKFFGSTGLYDRVNKCLVHCGAFVTHVYDYSYSYDLQAGDQIVEWNSVNLCNRSNGEVQQILLTNSDDEVEIVYLQRDSIALVYDLEVPLDTSAATTATTSYNQHRHTTHSKYRPTANSSFNDAPLTY